MRHIKLIKIFFSNNEFILQLDGSVYWPSKKSLILCDLHLEKSSYFAKLGSFLPPYDSFETLKRLENSLNNLDVKKIILLGDIFHDKNGLNRLNKKLKIYLENLCKRFEVIWLAGNHDGLIRPKSAKYCYKYKLDNINFNHKSIKKCINEFSGHYHPKAIINPFRIKISKPCFLISENKIILPAYGTFTGGIDSRSEIFKNVFNDKYKTFILLNKNIVEIN